MPKLPPSSSNTSLIEWAEDTAALFVRCQPRVEHWLKANSSCHISAAGLGWAGLLLAN